jgi:hypothetical protein
MGLYDQSQSINRSIKINRKNRSPLREEKVGTLLFTRPKRAMRGESGKHYKQCMEAMSAFRSATKYPPKHRPAAVWVPGTEN